jgi:hypothetical protein
MMKQRVASLMVALVAAASARAAIFVSPVEVTGVEHSFQAFTDPEFAGTSFSYDRFVAHHPGFVADLDQDTSLQYTLRAPEGKSFVSMRPAPRLTSISSSTRASDRSAKLI